MLHTCNDRWFYFEVWSKDKLRNHRIYLADLVSYQLGNRFYWQLNSQLGSVIITSTSKFPSIHHYKGKFKMLKHLIDQI